MIHNSTNKICKGAVKLRMVRISSNDDGHPVPKTFTPLQYA